MAFAEEIKKSVDEYARKHIADEDWHKSFFNFIDDGKLAIRLGEEFLAARYIYKLLEGLEADNWLKRAQIRLQILSYASIYEAALHHILFVNEYDNQNVVALTKSTAKKEISIPAKKLEILNEHLEHDGKKIIPMYEAVKKTDKSKVRFDKKAECAHTIGIIEESLKDELVEFYDARNAIHIHAEIRKGLDYEIDLSKRAYQRMQPFRDQVINWSRNRGISD